MNSPLSTATFLVVPLSVLVAQQAPRQTTQQAVQQAPPTTARAEERLDPRTGRPMVEAPRPDATETAEEAASRMYLSGRSLMQAQASLQADAGGDAERSQDDRVSFFAVPEPEPTVIEPHDLVTVIVREESSAKTSGKTDLSKEMSIDARLRDYIGVDLGELSLDPQVSDLAVRGEAERDFRGDGKVDRKDSFVARITAEVLDVKPNGTIVLQARKRITSDEEQQLFVLTGTCRTLDITADNTVLSTQLHDLNLEKQTKGSVRDTTRRGWIPRMIDRINPF